MRKLPRRRPQLYSSSPVQQHAQSPVGSQIGAATVHICPTRTITPQSGRVWPHITTACGAAVRCRVTHHPGQHQQCQHLPVRQDDQASVDHDLCQVMRAGHKLKQTACRHSSTAQPHSNIRRTVRAAGRTHSTPPRRAPPRQQGLSALSLLVLLMSAGHMVRSRNDAPEHHVFVPACRC